MAKPDRPTETELKLIVSPSAEERLAGLAAFRPPRASKPKTQHIVTTYFDTPNQDLARRGLSLRVRRAGKNRIQAVKANGNNSPAKARGEWEWPISGERPNLALAAKTPVAEALPPDIGKALGPVVVTDIVRTTRTLYVDEATIEAALDSGSIEAGDVTETVHELELELRDGKSGRSLPARARTACRHSACRRSRKQGRPRTSPQGRRRSPPAESGRPGTRPRHPCRRRAARDCRQRARPSARQPRLCVGRRRRGHPPDPRWTPAVALRAQAVSAAARTSRRGPVPARTAAARPGHRRSARLGRLLRRNAAGIFPRA